MGNTTASVDQPPSVSLQLSGCQGGVPFGLLQYRGQLYPGALASWGRVATGGVPLPNLREIRINIWGVYIYI